MGPWNRSRISPQLIICFLSNRLYYVFELSWNSASDFNPESKPRSQRTWETILWYESFPKMREKVYLHDLCALFVSWSAVKKWGRMFCDMGWGPGQVWTLTAPHTFRGRTCWTGLCSVWRLQGASQSRLLPPSLRGPTDQMETVGCMCLLAQHS